MQLPKSRKELVGRIGKLRLKIPIAKMSEYQIEKKKSPNDKIETQINNTRILNEETLWSHGLAEVATSRE